MPTHVKISIEPGIQESYLNSIDIINYNRLLVYIFILVFALGYNVNEKFEDTKGVIRSRKSKIPKGYLKVINLRYQRGNQKS